MKYLKVKPEFDQHRRKDGDILVANELYTEREAEKLRISRDLCDCVEIPKSRVYWFFGARFAEA